jgi:hypothetical protein
MTAYLRDAQSPQNITYTSFADGPITLYLNGGQLYSGRYSVVFEPTSTTGIATTQQSTTKIYSYGSTVYVNRSSSDAATISVVNLLGQNMAELNSHSQQMSFGLPAIQPWYAIVKVTEGEKVTVAKVLISNK